jgi:ribonucleotide monophosphatase NagD (HAD superfamily)
MISGALLDLAGVIYEGEKALPGALDAVGRLREAGLSLRFVTNTTRMTKHTVLQRLARLGLLTNVCFEGKNGHDAGATSFPLMTRSGPSAS